MGILRILAILVSNYGNRAQLHTALEILTQLHDTPPFHGDITTPWRAHDHRRRECAVGVHSIRTMQPQRESISEALSLTGMRCWS